ncbi:hypothetical protein ACPWSR_12885 [Alloiococcus sp. CFN-8]|uniref:hypothetical protein n=1 Tax=Alloiococcus sp. CFN-8 TaxID=3416081 RepID=UPI003CF1B14D
MFEELKKMKKELFPKCEFIIEYPGIVSTPEEIIKVLIDYCSKEQKALTVLKESMTPIVKIDGKTYIARIDQFVGAIGGGRKLDTPHPLPYLNSSLRGQSIFVYPYDYIEG